MVYQCRTKGSNQHFQVKLPAALQVTLFFCYGALKTSRDLIMMAPSLTLWPLTLTCVRSTFWQTVVIKGKANQVEWTCYFTFNLFLFVLRRISWRYFSVFWCQRDSSTISTCRGCSSPQRVTVGCCAFVFECVLMSVCVWAGWVESGAIIILWSMCVHLRSVEHWGAVCAVTLSAGHRNHIIQTLRPLHPAFTMWVCCVGENVTEKRKAGSGWSLNFRLWKCLQIAAVA